MLGLLQSPPKNQRSNSDNYLSLSKLEGRGELGTLGYGQVPPFAELLLERHELLVRERRPRLPVRLVLPEIALELRWLSVFCNKRKKKPFISIPWHRCVESSDRSYTRRNFPPVTAVSGGPAFARSLPIRLSILLSGLKIEVRKS